MQHFLEKYEKYAAWFFFGLMFLCLISMAALGFYNHPVGDDYHYGYGAIMAWRENGSLMDVLKAAAAGTAEQFSIWQGTYSAMFFMHIPPQVFGDFFYKIYPTVLLTCFVGGFFYLTHALLCTLYKAKRSAWILLSSLLVLLFTQQVPLTGETFYWYNGSMYYTGFLACTFVFWGGTIEMLCKPTVAKAVLLSLLAFFIAGGNYTSLLPTLIILVLMLLCYGYQYFVKKEAVKKPLLLLAVVFLSMLAGFLISVLAPGNALRQATSWKISPVSAIFKSIYHSARYCIYWNGIWSVLFVIFATPVMLKVIAGCNRKFKYAPIVCGLIFGIYCSASTPTFYAQNNGGAARVFCLVYYLMILAQAMIYFYALGALYNLLKNSRKEKLSQKPQMSCVYVTGAVLVVLVLGLTICRPWGEAYVKPHALTAAQAILSGDAAYYDKQYLERVEILENSSVEEVVLAPLDVPESLNYSLFLGDLSTDEKMDVNQKVAQIYGKKSVRVQIPE